MPLYASSQAKINHLFSLNPTELLKLCRIRSQGSGYFLASDSLLLWVLWYEAKGPGSLEPFDLQLSFVFMKISSFFVSRLAIGVLRDCRKLNFFCTPRSAIPPSFDITQTSLPVPSPMQCNGLPQIPLQDFRLLVVDVAFMVPTQNLPVPSSRYPLKFPPLSKLMQESRPVPSTLQWDFLAVI